MKDTQKRAPNFTPWDRGQFLERLKTFRHVDKWMSKPEEVNEVQWAKRGWTCIGKERVACAGCGREVVVKLENEEEIEGSSGEDMEGDDWRVSAQQQLVEKYSGMIVSEHEEGCLWRSRGCDGTILISCIQCSVLMIVSPATIYRLPLTHPTTSLNELGQRYESLASISSEIPSSLSTPGSFDIEMLSRQLSFIFSSSSSSDASVPDHIQESPQLLNEQALTLAFFGWQVESCHVTGLATCNACFRRLGLWLFRSKPSLSEGVEDDEAIMSRLDVVEEHRDYCPWINVSSQSGGTTPRKGATPTAELAGWEILRRVVQNQQYQIAGSITPPALRGIEEGDDDSRSDVGSAGSTYSEDKATRDAKDKERWAKLKKLKQVFRVKSVKNLRRGKENIPISRPGTVG